MERSVERWAMVVMAGGILVAVLVTKEEGEARSV